MGRVAYHRLNYFRQRPRAPFPLMSSPFNRITVDGVTHRDADVLRWADELVEGHGGGVWTTDVRSTLRGLVGEGELKAHTSGTTGAPRPHAFSAADVVASANLTRDAFGLLPGDRALLCLPCEFVGGKMMLARAMLLGLDLHAIDPRGGVLRNLRTMDRFRFAALIPMQLYTAVQQDRALVEERFDTILLGGGPVGRDLIAMLRDLRTCVVLGYGSTETLTHVALRPLNGPDASELYTAQGDVTFAQSEDGRLVIRTPHLSVKEHVTNDAAELLDERRMRWLGRRDNVILSGGRKIHPERLEAMTAGIIPYPHFFAALPDQRLGQAVVLVLETGSDADRIPPGTLESLKGVLYEHERPRRAFALREFTRTGTGKVDRTGTLALVAG